MADTITSLKKQVAAEKARAAKAQREVEAMQKAKAGLSSRLEGMLSDQTFNWSEFKSNPGHTLKHLLGE